MTTVKRNKLIALLLVLALLGATVFSATYSWLAGSNIIKSTVTGGSILTSYFHTGDGSEENPFVITRPLHFYNMIYLYQRLEGFADEGYYFQLGYQLLYDEDDAEPDENYYFYRYGDDGKIIAGQYSNVLNMEYYNDGEGMGGALLPIGTSNVPFIGTFDGKGLTVANLHVTATETIGNETLGTSDVGVFGYVDEAATIKDTYFNGVTIDLTGLDPTVTTEDDTHDDTVHDEDKNGTADLSYVGYLAGHIKTSSVVQNVYLNDCHVIGGAAARSGYGFFGCVEKAEGGLVDSLGSEIATLRGEGDNAGFGGSIDMYSTFQRLMTIYNTVRSGTSQYVSAETIVIDKVEGGSENVLVPPSPTMTNYTNYPSSSVTYKTYASPSTGGSFMFPSDNDTTDYKRNDNVYECLFGESTTYSKTVTTYTYKNEFDEDGLLISIDGTYLNTTTSAISAGNVKAEATIWQLDNQGHLNALLEESTQYNTYYLNASANGTLSVSTSATTVWTKTEDQNHEGTLTYTSGGRTWYLSYDGSAFAGYPFDSAYAISNGANYLVQSGSTTLAGTAGNHADWHFEDGKLMTFINKTIYYLNASAGTLSLGTAAGSATTWTKDGNTFTYTDGNGVVWYLAYNGGWCCVPFASGFTIANNTNYLGYNGSAISSVAAGNALHFALEGGKLVTFYNNTLYYLNASAGALSLGTNAGSATTWNDTGTGFTYTDGNGVVWYLCYNGGWCCVPFASGFTIANNTNYLGYSGTAISSVAAGNALHFSLEGGKLVTYYNNTFYYLNASANGTLSLGTSAGSATTWTKTEDQNHEGTLTYTSGGRTWYLSYDGSAWAGYPFDSAFSISNGANYLVQSNSTTLAGTAGNHAGWHFENGKLMTFINKTLYYLNASAGSLSLGTSEGSATTWTRNGNVFSYTDGNSRVWYLAYNGGWCCVPFASGFTIANGTNYLGYNGSAISSVASGNALHFSFEDGKVVTYYNNTLYYLTATGGTLSLTTSVPSITWVKGANTLSYTDAGSRTWYLRYLNGAWSLFPSLSAYTIRSGSSYFGVSGSNLIETNAAGAATFGVDGSKLFTIINGEINYLVGSTDGSGTLSFTTTRANGTDWTYTQGGGTMSYSGGGQTWYLYDVNDAWKVYPGASVSLISQSGNYLGAASNTTVGTDASSWTVSGGNIYTYYNGATRYLVSNGESVALANSPSDTWTVNTTVTNQNGWYLVYDDGWKMIPSLSYVLITDGAGNYLNRNGTSGVTNGTSEGSATKWYSDGSKFYSVSGATKYYLTGTNTALSVTATPGNGTAFSYDGTNKRLSYTYNANTYYVVYNDGWSVSANNIKGYKISTVVSSTTHYLNATSSAVSDGTSTDSATVWTYNDSTHRLACTINGTVYYLRGSLEATQTRDTTNLAVTQNSSDSGTSWTISGSNLTCSLTVDNAAKTFTLVYDENGAWKLMDLSKNYSTLMNSGNYYLATNSNANPSLTRDNSTSAATLWTFSNPDVASGSTFQLYTVINGKTYYLVMSTSNNRAASLSTTSSNVKWYAATYTYVQSTNGYDLGYNSGWKSINSNNNTYRLTRTQITFSPASLTFTNVEYSTEETTGSVTATTTFTTMNALNNVTFTSTETGTTLTFANVSENVTHTTTAEADRNTNTMAPTSENVAQTKSAVSENVTHTTTAASDRSGLDFETKRRQHIEKTVQNNVASGSPTYFPIRVDKDESGNYPSGYAASPKNTGYIISGANLINSGSTPTTQKKWGDIRVSGFLISNVGGSWSTSGLTVSKIRSDNNYLYLKKDEETETYSIANTTNADLANFWQYSNNKLFTTVGKTKYWLTYDNGLKLSETEGVDWTFSNNNRLAYNNNYIKYANDAWVATANTANLTLTLGTLNTVYTYDGSGNHALTAAQKTDAYYQAALQLSQTLATSSTHVFGLHFMDAAISTDHIVTAPKASIFGTEYTDYEFPEDSVDFHVIERGSISFFAGEYFSSNGATNDAFFSLHQVYRYSAKDEIPEGKKVNDIKYIKQISEIYKHATSGDSVNYVYKFTDNTYSNPDGTYTGANSLADGYSNTAIFKTSWITAPSGLSTNNSRIYYFEIPCNAGEYCLGSVSGKTGAYLIYLDIAANGGEELASAISGTGNDVVTSFQTEFRDAPDTMDHSVILLSYDAPAGSTENTFSVSVNFDKTSASALEDPHPNGLYTIDVLNKTGQDVTLYVYLCDDDFNLLTEFPYAYKVHYTNNTTGSGGTYLETTFGDTFQMMAGFTIPSSGEAIEVSYH